MKEQLRQSFKELCALVGVSGSEQEVVRYVRDAITPHADAVRVDRIGNLIATKKGIKPGPTVAIVAHTDEVGYCVKGIHDNGFITFDKIGSISNKVLEGRKIWINGSIPGIIGIRPGHLNSPTAVPTINTPRQCYIDTGMTSRSAVEALGIKIGSKISFDGAYQEMANPDMICTKSVDDRINCAIIIELFKQIQNDDFAGTLYGVFTVQEEIGMRGAAVLGNILDMDYAIVLDTIPAGDTPDINTVQELPVYLSKGPVCPVMDGVVTSGLHSHVYPKVLEMIEDQSEAVQINVQYATLVGDGYLTDATHLHISGQGVPCGTLAVPRRYSHSPVELFDLNDAVGSLKVLQSIVRANGYKNLDFI